MTYEDLVKEYKQAHDYYITIHWYNKAYKYYTKTIIIRASHHNFRHDNRLGTVMELIFKNNKVCIPTMHINNVWYLDEDGSNFDKMFSEIPKYAIKTDTERSYVGTFENTLYQIIGK